MASSKDIPHASRPLSQHRLSMSNGGSLPVRTNHSRHHSHSVSLGSLNSSHRVTRRKSMSTNATNVAAVAAAAKEVGESPLGTSIPSSSRRNTMSKGKTMPTPPGSLPTHRIPLISTGHTAEKDESAIDDDQNDDMDHDNVSFTQARMRRASDGQQLSGKKLNANDLRCQKCGKNYKHSSCLTKHLWEHTPEWSYTSKLLISKHQQVQLLEAASVLVTMNQDGTTPPDSAKDFQSDAESASPAESGSSEHLDGLSSTDTTPPPQTEVHSSYMQGESFTTRPKRYSSGTGYSRSYQSAPYSTSSFPSSFSTTSGNIDQNFQSVDRRPLSSGISIEGQEDEAGLAAAVELLSCSFGTPRSGPVTLPPDIPPVPPLPARYQSYSAQNIFTTKSANASNGGLSLQGAATSYVRGSSDTKDVKMEEHEGSMADDEEYEARTRDRSDEEDDGIFGRMEE